MTSQTVYDITYMWNIKRKKIKQKKQRNPIETEQIDDYVGWGGTNGWRLLKEYKLPARRLINPGDMMYSMVNIANNTAFMFESC